MLASRRRRAPSLLIIESGEARYPAFLPRGNADSFFRIHIRIGNRMSSRGATMWRRASRSHGGTGLLGRRSRLSDSSARDSLARTTRMILKGAATKSFDTRSKNLTAPTRTRYGIATLSLSQYLLRLLPRGSTFLSLRTH